MNTCALVQWLVFMISSVGALCRYLGRKKCVQSVCVQPPFLRPQLTEAQLAAKILDNGIQGDLHRVRTTGWVLMGQALLTLNIAFYNHPVLFKHESEGKKELPLPVGRHMICKGFCLSFKSELRSLHKSRSRRQSEVYNLKCKRKTPISPESFCCFITKDVKTQTRVLMMCLFILLRCQEVTVSLLSCE